MCPDSFCKTKEVKFKINDKRSQLKSIVLPQYRLSLVRMKGLEPSRLAAHAPKACVSTNSTTSA